MTPPARRGGASEWSRKRIERRILELGEWFHNLDLRGVRTAPHHFLGDYPGSRWKRIEHAIPADLAGRSVLDIGCNAGFHAMAMKQRGAGRVLGIDADERYLNQARFAAEVSELDIEFRRLSVYDIAELGETFDWVLFMGVFYHLRHPLLALDLIHAHVARDFLLFQSMQRGSAEVEEVGFDHGFEERTIFDRPGFPRMHFIEHRYCGDPTNWWLPNRACAEAMLRSAGFEILNRPGDESYVCRRQALEIAHWDHRAVYPGRGPKVSDGDQTMASLAEGNYD